MEAIRTAVRCPVCCHTFQDPRILQPCAHTCCLHCIQSNLDIMRPLCPFCQQEFDLPRRGLKDLLRNPIVEGVVTLTEMTETFGKERFCRLHPRQENLFYCKNCQCPICIECCRTTHAKHNCVTLETVDAEFQETIGHASEVATDRMNNQRDLLQQIFEQEKAIERNKLQETADLKSSSERAIQMIETQCARMIEIVKQRQMTCLKRIESERKQQVERFKAKKEDCEKQILEAQLIVDCCQRSSYSSTAVDRSTFAKQAHLAATLLTQESGSPLLTRRENVFPRKPTVSYDVSIKSTAIPTWINVKHKFTLHTSTIETSDVNVLYANKGKVIVNHLWSNTLYIYDLHCTETSVSVIALPAQLRDAVLTSKNQLICATWDKILILKEDNGEHIQHIDKPNPRALAILTEGELLFLSDDNEGICWSTDNGLTWTLVIKMLGGWRCSRLTAVNCKRLPDDSSPIKLWSIECNRTSTLYRLRLYSIDLQCRVKDVITMKDVIGENEGFINLEYSCLAFDGLDSVFLTEFEKNIVHIFSTNGDYLGQFLSSADGIEKPIGLTVDNHRLIIGQNNTVKVFELEGQQKFELIAVI